MLDFDSTLDSRAVVVLYSLGCNSCASAILSKQAAIDTQYKHYGIEGKEHSSKSLPWGLGRRDSHTSTWCLGAWLVWPEELGLLKIAYTPPKTVESSSGQQREPKVQDGLNLKMFM